MIFGLNARDRCADLFDGTAKHGQVEVAHADRERVLQGTSALPTSTTMSFDGQWIRYRSIWSRPSFRGLVSNARWSASGASWSRQTFVVTKSSVRGQPRGCDGGADRRLVLVHGCGVDMAVAERERALDHRLGGGAGHAERAEAEPGHHERPAW